MVAVERVAGVAAAVEDQVVGVDADLCGDENGVAGEVDKGDQTRGGIGDCAGGGDNYGELLWLSCWADRIDRAYDGTVRVATANEGCQN